MPTSLPAHLLRAADRLAALFGIARRLPAAEQLLAAARERTGLADFGDVAVLEPLRVLLAAFEAESELTLFGRIGARWDLARYLVNLLILRERETRLPEILGQLIEQPIFITGLPRSGTTFLHRLLAQDPANLVPRCWQTIYPYPGHPAAGRSAGPRRVERQFRAFARIAPELRSLHPFDADSPQECTEITAHTFASRRFDITHEIPSYRRWLAGVGHRDAYRFHRRFLQHLQHQTAPEGPAGRWVLKCPDHVFALDAIAEVYPDARIVFVHRDPLKVLASSCRLTEVLRRPFSRRVDRLRLGRQIADDWAAAARQLIQASERGSPFGSDRVLHIQYRALVSDPFGSVAAMYSHLGIPLDAAAAAAMRRLIAEQPRGGYGRNSYRFADYGLDPEREARRFRDYVQHFQIEPEPGPAAPSGAIPTDRPAPPRAVQLSHGL
jgi:hypothetical protein